MDPIEYLRQFRLGGFAVFDVAVSFLGMLALSPPLSYLCARAGIHVPKRNWVILTLPIGILVHLLVGKITPLTKDVLDPTGHYLAKMVIAVSTILGMFGIERITPTLKDRAS